MVKLKPPIRLTAGVTAGFTEFAMLLAVLIGFPVPFLMLVGGMPNVLVIGGMLLLMFGIAPFRSTSPLRPYLKTLLNFLVAHETLVAIYLLVKALYAFVPPKYQGSAMLLLPLWKFGAKKYVGHAIQDLKVFMPEIVAFNVDYFSTLFVSVCMYNSGSLWVSVLAILVDVLVSLLEFRELGTSANVVYSLLLDQKNWSDNRLWRQGTEDLLTLMLEVIRIQRPAM